MFTILSFIGFFMLFSYFLGMEKHEKDLDEKPGFSLKQSAKYLETGIEEINRNLEEINRKLEEWNRDLKNEHSRLIHVRAERTLTRLRRAQAEHALRRLQQKNTERLVQSKRLEDALLGGSAEKNLLQHLRPQEHLYVEGIQAICQKLDADFGYDPVTQQYRASVITIQQIHADLIQKSSQPLSPQHMRDELNRLNRQLKTLSRPS